MRTLQDRMRRELIGMSPGHLLCGFSGGADSTALLLLLHGIAEELGISLIALHAHHGLRNTADDDERWCADFCFDRGISLISKRLNVPSNRGTRESMESAARRLRYAFFEEAASTFVSPLVVLGHHADDAAENLLIRLMRGGNLSALMSPSPVSRMGTLTLYRPLLSATHAELLDFLRSENVSWREDETNAEPCCGRNFIRLQLLPALYDAFSHGRHGLHASLTALRQDSDFLNAAAARAFEASCRGRALDAAVFTGLHSSLRQRVLRRYFGYCGSDAIPTVALMRRLDEAVAKGGDEPLWISVSTHERLRIGRDAIQWFGVNAPLENHEFTVGNDCRIPFGSVEFEFIFHDSTAILPLTERSVSRFFFDARMAGSPLVLRTVRPDDLFHPFGHTEPLPIKRFAEKSGILSAERLAMTVLVSADDPGCILVAAGLRRSAHFPVTESTTRILEIKVRDIQSKIASTAMTRR